MDEKLMRAIDRAIKETWVKEIQEDYYSNSILKEDSLKNALYHHLRTRLDYYKEDRVRIFTEFSDNGLKGTGYRADIAIVILKKDFDMYYLGDNVEKVISLIELKFKGRRCQPHQLMADIDKTKMYINGLKMDCCQFYLGFIHEYSYPKKEARWLDNRASLNWAKDKVTELSACKFDEDGDDMKFYIHSYNNLNPELNHDIC